MKTSQDWTACFAQRTTLMRRNTVRELLKVASRPDIISFAGGLPAAELFPVETIKTALAAVLDRVGGAALQYSTTEGLPGLRAWLARRFSNRRLRVDPENILITTGAQQALDLIGRILLDEGDRVIVENPTYLALLSAWRPLGVKFLPVASDAGGMRMTECELQMRAGPQAVYCAPNFQNPQGVTLSAARRVRLVALARRFSTVLIEDDPYGELRYEGKPLPSLLALDATHRPGLGLDTRVIYTGTFSKTLMPGLRVGWVIAPRPVIEKLTQAKQAADLHTSTLSQHLVLELLSRDFLRDFVPVLRRHYRRRRDAMLAALKKYFPNGASWTHPRGGMFLWVHLPESMDASRLLPTALAQGVAFVPGEAFHLNGRGKNTLRLNFSSVTPERIDAGIKTLGHLVNHRRGLLCREPTGDSDVKAG